MKHESDQGKEALELREPSTGRGWEEDTLVDKLDVYIQMLHVLEDLLNVKADQSEGLSPEETARAATVLSIYRRKYDKARTAWIEVVS